MGEIKRHPKIDHLEGDGGEDESWLVSYVDLISILLSFFIVLFSLSKIDSERMDKVSEKMTEALGEGAKNASVGSNVAFQMPEKEVLEKSMKEAIADLDENQVKEYAKSVEKSLEEKSKEKAFKELLEKLAPKNKALTLEFTFQSVALFQPGSAQFSKDITKKLLPIVQKIRKIEKVATVEVVGHSDSSPVKQAKNFKDNWSLSAARAGAITAQLVKLGVPKDVLIARGVANTRLLVNDMTKSGKLISKNQKLNRRVQIIVKSKTSGDK